MAAASGAAAAYGSLPFDGIVDAKPGTSHFGVDHPVLRFDHDDNEQFDLLASHQRQQQRQLGSFSLPSRLEALLAGAQDRWLSVRPDRRALLARACVALTALVLLIAVISVSVSVSKSRRASRRAEAEALAGRTELCGWSSLYLPTVVTPSLYRLALQINLDRPSAVAPQLYGLHDGAPPPAQAFYVYGHLDTTVRAARPTACVVLHAAELNLRAVYLTLPGAPAVEGAVLRRNETSQQVVVKFDELLPADEVVLHFAFDYPLQEGLDGLYRSTYVDAATNVTHTIASTQFEAIAARKAFPCFDEPQWKAAFQAELIAPPPPIVALSNMPLAAPPADLANGMTHYKYQTTPTMSTYLLAFVVGNLSRLSTDCPQHLPPNASAVFAFASSAATSSAVAGAGSGSGGDAYDALLPRLLPVPSVPVSVWAAPGKTGQLGTALEAACAALKAFSTALQVPYTLPKLDLVAVPNFAAGAMENWGLVLYRESALLVDGQVDDVAQRFWIASVVSHEIAHQWFGNLVTCHDWTSLWLNEGFATYFETVAADAYRPQYDYFKYFYSDTVAGALVADAAPSSHALTKPGRVASLSEIDAMFDSLTYDKGGAVLRMVRAYLNRGALTAGAGAGVLPGPRLRLRSRRRRQLRQQPSYSTSSPSSSPSFSSSPSPSLSSSSSSLSSSSLALATVDTDPFLSGLRAYLTDNQLGVGTHEKMWGQVGSASGSPAASWMRAWTLRPGYPLLDVSVEVGAPPAAGSSSAAPPAVTIHIAQQSVHSVACNTTADPLSAWWVPLSFVLSSQPAAVTWRSFDGCSVSIPLPADLAAAWVAGGNASYVLINPGRYGFYQTRYSPPLAAALAAAAATNASLVPGVDLAGLLDDARLMGQLGKLPLGPASATAFLELTAALGRRGGEVDLPSWKAALKGLSQLDRLLRSAAAAPGGGSRGSSDSSGSSSSSSTGAAAAATWSACSAALQMYIRDQLTGPFLAGAKLPPPPGSAGRTRRTGLSFQVSPALDTPEVRMLRPLVLTAAGQAGDAAVLSEAKDLVSSILDAGTAAVVSPDVRGAAYNLAVRSGDADAYAAIKQWYLAPSTPADEQERLLGALTWAPDDAAINATLRWALTPQLKLQDLGRFLVRLGSHGGPALYLTWDFLLTSMDQLLARYPAGGATYSLGRRLNDLAALLTDDGWLPRIRDFAARYGDSLDPQLAAAAADSAAANAAWLRDSAPAVCAWLDRAVRATPP